MTIFRKFHIQMFVSFTDIFIKTNKKSNFELVYQIKWGGGVTRSVSYKNKHVIQFPGISLKSKNGRIA
jgi:hypothetical protein